MPAPPRPPSRSSASASAPDEPPTPTIALAPASAVASGQRLGDGEAAHRAAGTIVDFEAGGLPRSANDDRYVVYVREEGKIVAKATFTVDKPTAGPRSR